jgi:hypothetical protein
MISTSLSPFLSSSGRQSRALLGYFAAAFPFSDPKIGRLEASFSAVIACQERDTVWKVLIDRNAHETEAKPMPPCLALTIQFCSNSFMETGTRLDRPLPHHTLLLVASLGFLLRPRRAILHQQCRSNLPLQFVSVQTNWGNIHA